MKSFKKIGFCCLIMLFFLSACSSKETSTEKPPPVQTTSTNTIPTQTQPTIATISDAPEVSTNIKTTKRLSTARIGIDPGHQAKGNKEQEPVAPRSSTMKNKVSSGSQGAFSKTNEHEINLSVAQKLRDKLEAEGATVIMTRTSTDVDISNRERALMLNDYNVDLVIRIHCDGNENASIYGASVLIPDGEDTITIQEDSKLLGEIIIQAFCKETDAKNRGIMVRDDQTGFNWSTVPVCTIEMGFLSNQAEDELLNTEKYQDQCAQGIFNGIAQYCDSIS